MTPHLQLCSKFPSPGGMYDDTKTCHSQYLQSLFFLPHNSEIWKVRAALSERRNSLSGTRNSLTFYTHSLTTTNRSRWGGFSLRDVQACACRIVQVWTSDQGRLERFCVIWCELSKHSCLTINDFTPTLTKSEKGTIMIHILKKNGPGYVNLWAQLYIFRIGFFSGAC